MSNLYRKSMYSLYYTVMSVQYIHIHIPYKYRIQSNSCQKHLFCQTISPPNTHWQTSHLYDFPPVSPYSNVDFVHHSCSYEPSSWHHACHPSLDIVWPGKVGDVLVIPLHGNGYISHPNGKFGKSLSWNIPWGPDLLVLREYFFLFWFWNEQTHRPKRHGTHPFRLIIAATSLPVGKTPSIFGDLQGKAPPKFMPLVFRFRN